MKKIAIILLMLLSCFTLFACGEKNSTETDGTTTEGFLNPGDTLGGGGVSDSNVIEKAIDTKEIEGIISDLSINSTATYEDYTVISEETTITNPGNYLINSTINGKIEVKCEEVHLFLNNAVMTNGKKVIDSNYDLIITVSGENTLTNTNTDDTKNVINCSGNLTINGDGILNVISVKNGIKADKTLSILNTNINVEAQNHGLSAESICLDSTLLDITSVKDGIHSEIDYDDVLDIPVYTNELGFVYLHNSDITITSIEDGIQADSFIYIDGGTINVTTNNGAPNSITETSSDNASGKGIKAGNIDYMIGEEEYELISEEYAIIIKNANIDVNANDDAIHSNGYMLIESGNIAIKSGDDGLHSETVTTINNGTINVIKSYEALESATVQIKGGIINLNANDDGINAADGTSNTPGVANNNCQILITGGSVYVNASGDGIDSNGAILITGGTITIDGPTNGGNGSLDSESGVIVNGGTIFACGALGMVEVPATNSSQYVISFASKSSVVAGTILRVLDNDGNELCSFTTAKACQSIIISSPSFALNGIYNLYGGDTLLTSFTIGGIITSIGTSSSSINPGGRPSR